MRISFRNQRTPNMRSFLTGVASLVVSSILILSIYQQHTKTSLNPITKTTLSISNIKNTSTSATSEEQDSCLSRRQSVSYQKPTPHKQSSHLINKLQSYQKLHQRCGPGTFSYNKTIQQLKSGNKISTECQYVIWVAYGGLGNRMLSLTSVFLYALLTNRVLLINQQPDMENLFCEPFPQSSWILPDDFPLKNDFNSFKKSYNLTYGNLLKTNVINHISPSSLFLYLCHDYDHQDKLFFCDQDQAVLNKVPWLIIKSNVYFIPSLFLISSYVDELTRLFPDKETVFHHLGRYLFYPSDRVWSMITQYYQDYKLAEAEKVIGLQIRVFGTKFSPFEHVMDQILSCSKNEKLLLDTQDSVTRSPSNRTKTKAVILTSLFKGYYEKLKQMYGENSTVEIYQPSNEGRQRSDRNSHNMQAWAEMYLLSLCDELVTSAWSTFGYVAQGLRGIKPLILYKIYKKKPKPACGRGVSMEPCYHAPPIYDCKAKTVVDTATLVPYVKHCEDIRWGIKLVNVSE